MLLTWVSGLAGHGVLGVRTIIYRAVWSGGIENDLNISIIWKLCFKVMVGFLRTTANGLGNSFCSENTFLSIIYNLWVGVEVVLLQLWLFFHWLICGCNLAVNIFLTWVNTTFFYFMQPLGSCYYGDGSEISKF